MELFAKLILLGALAVMLWQDLKERQVWWFLLPLFGLSGGYLFFINAETSLFRSSLVWNLAIIGVVLVTLFAYSKWRLRKDFFTEAFGLGDLLFFIAFAISLPTISFLYFFVSALVFSLLVFVLTHVLFRPRDARSFSGGARKHNTVPLAGMMSLFLIMVYSAHWMGYFETLYLF